VDVESRILYGLFNHWYLKGDVIIKMQRMADEHKNLQPLFMSLTILLAPAFPIIYTMYIFSSFQCLGVCMLHFSHNSQRVPKE